MPQSKFQPCIPTRGTKVPAGPDWLHEIKHDGYRLIVQREDKRVRLFTRPGYDWSIGPIASLHWTVSLPTRSRLFPVRAQR